MKISFCKYHGAGNDFILVDNRDGLFNLSTGQVAKLCNRHMGIGADGLILLQEAEKYDFLMRYFNADGNEASLCGNGGRCIVAFAQDLGIIETTTNFWAVDGEHQAEVLASSESIDIIRLKMNDVIAWKKSGDDLVFDTGSPHLTKIVDDVEKIDVFNEGRKIRYSEEFINEGVNVNFVSMEEGHLKIRTYERGVEKETLACGTGAVASALAASFHHYKSPVKLKALGGELIVSFDFDENYFSNIWLEGPATFVFEGEINI